MQIRWRQGGGYFKDVVGRLISGQPPELTGVAFKRAALVVPSKLTSRFDGANKTIVYLHRLWYILRQFNGYKLPSCYVDQCIYYVMISIFGDVIVNVHNA